MELDVAARLAKFRALHAQGCFVLPNPWDIGGVRRLERLGFEALATTSSGCANALGLEDGEITLEDTLAHLQTICASTSLPVNADFENGYAEAPADVAANVTRALATGIAGISIEDRVRKGGLYDHALSVERVAAAREAIDRAAVDVVLVARCEGYLIDALDLEEVIHRLRAYAAAGADCVYAPGVVDAAEVRLVVDAVEPVPVNVLLYQPSQTVSELADLGVRRISVGSALAKESWLAFDRAATSLRDHGRLPG